MYKYVRKQNPSCIERFKEKLADYHWDNILNQVDVNRTYEKFIGIVDRLYNEYCPYKTG